MRLALGLGMHRSVPPATNLGAVERQARIRVWWSLYFFDRFTCSKLGQPVSIRDEDIDVELPSMNGLSPGEQDEFAEPSQLCAAVGLARIAGDICRSSGKKGKKKEKEMYPILLLSMCR